MRASSATDMLQEIIEFFKDINYQVIYHPEGQICRFRSNRESYFVFAKHPRRIFKPIKRLGSGGYNIVDEVNEYKLKTIAENNEISVKLELVTSVNKMVMRSCCVPVKAAEEFYQYAAKDIKLFNLFYKKEKHVTKVSEDMFGFFLEKINGELCCQIVYLQHKLPGDSLEHIFSNSKISQLQFVEIFKSALLAMQRLREIGISHCDISPGNLLWSFAEKKLFVIDFCFAKKLGELTKIMAGNRLYSSFEVFDESAIAYTYDLSSMGIVLAEASGCDLALRKFFLVEAEGEYPKDGKKLQDFFEQPFDPDQIGTDLFFIGGGKELFCAHFKNILQGMTEMLAHNRFNHIEVDLLMTRYLQDAHPQSKHKRNLSESTTTLTSQKAVELMKRVPSADEFRNTRFFTSPCSSPIDSPVNSGRSTPIPQIKI